MTCGALHFENKLEFSPVYPSHLCAPHLLTTALPFTQLTLGYHEVDLAKQDAQMCIPSIWYLDSATPSSWIPREHSRADVSNLGLHTGLQLWDANRPLAVGIQKQTWSDF